MALLVCAAGRAVKRYWGPVRCSRAARAPLLRCPQTPSARSSALALGLPQLSRGPVQCSGAPRPARFRRPRTPVAARSRGRLPWWPARALRALAPCRARQSRARQTHPNLLGARLCSGTSRPAVQRPTEGNGPVGQAGADRVGCVGGLDGSARNPNVDEGPLIGEVCDAGGLHSAAYKTNAGRCERCALGCFEWMIGGQGHMVGARRKELHVGTGGRVIPERQLREIPRPTRVQSGHQNRSIPPSARQHGRDV